MKTKVISEEPAFSLKGGSGYDRIPYEILDVSWSDLFRSEIGKKWETADPYCDRDSQTESAEVVYKTTYGIAVLFKKLYTTDSPEPVERKVMKLIWYEFHD